MFYEKGLQKTNKTDFSIEKVIKSDELYVKQKGYDNSFNSCIDKKDIVQILYKMSQCFPKLYERSGENIQVELGLSNYATKVDLKGGTGADTSNLVA